jgi:hypothetical protein
MQGDFERVTFSPDAGFANVLLQQGRLLLAADFNEQSAILQHFLRSLIVDLKSRAWRPNDEGFEIEVAADADLQITITAGHFYVDGILCENNVERQAYETQLFLPDPTPVADLDDDEAIVYLDCWERHVTWLNYSRLREPALGGPDTATRAQIVWQVRVLSKQDEGVLNVILEGLEARQETDKLKKAALKDRVDAVKAALAALDALDAATAPEVLDALGEARPRLIADAKHEAAALEPCAIAAAAEYRGRENQLYRVEVHKGGAADGLPDGATFKWSRENGSVIFRIVDITSAGSDTKVSIESLGHDRRTGLCAGDWVEVLDDALELGGKPGELRRVTKVDPQRRTVTLAGSTSLKRTDQRLAILRRWDHQSEDPDGAIFVKESRDATGWIDLERGVRIRFLPGGVYRTGDYWLIPARVETGDIEWPFEGAVRRAVEPHGITHHRAVLGVVKKGAGGNWEPL